MTNNARNFCPKVSFTYPLEKSTDAYKKGTCKIKNTHMERRENKKLNTILTGRGDDGARARTRVRERPHALARTRERACTCAHAHGRLKPEFCRRTKEFIESAM